MGLFRRGNKLLRLGSGLRDCCCRPEKPEECWCPDWCRYYWDWGGTTVFPAREYLKNSCEQSNLDVTYVFNGYPSFGFLGTVLNINVALIGRIGNSFTVRGRYGYALEFGHYAFIDGYVSEQAQNEIFGSNVFGRYGVYYVGHQVTVTCLTNPQTGLSSIIFIAQSDIDIRLTASVSSNPYFIHLVSRSVSGTINATACESNGQLFCPASPFEDRYNLEPRLHLNEDVDFVFGDAGITVNGTLYEWEEEPVGLYGGLPIIDNRDATDLWKVAGDFPFEATVTLKRRDSCREDSGPCDCDLDLTGRTVVFEGRTFTYGSLQQFISDDGLTIWEEGPSAGTFTREDRRECDPTVSMRIRTAEVSCSTFDGVPRWFVYLDSECYERESGGCAPTVTASKITLYNGAFSCDSDGYPLGAAHSFTDDTDPPDLDGENISGTPSTNCDVENPIPSISFS
jgi:hypothetical protein